ncbi:Low molecular weight protein-tyrosine-phosphatase etp [Pigmentiphaga humi]|uniref:Low molecular weight protein-tyrosine-phosphatase etp n=2 Tax=Pigmentiphaga humi TaxID=2478468 RepID=A0A3P4B217_9BURK|nr:Low molecular weight protein-tyrosine-phosphatase etp [Pigmentiphaga humi]
MDSEHRREVQRRYPVASGKTFLLGQWQSLEIADPINEPLPAFELAWQQCNDGAKAWVERLSAAGLVCAKATA